MSVMEIGDSTFKVKDGVAERIRRIAWILSESEDRRIPYGEVVARAICLMEKEIAGKSK